MMFEPAWWIGQARRAVNLASAPADARFPTSTFFFQIETTTNIAYPYFLISVILLRFTGILRPWGHNQKEHIQGSESWLVAWKKLTSMTLPAMNS